MDKKSHTIKLRMQNKLEKNSTQMPSTNNMDINAIIQDANLIGFSDFVSIFSDSL